MKDMTKEEVEVQASLNRKRRIAECLGTRSESPRVPSFSVETACACLAHCVHEDMGTRNGETALYWHLIAVIHEHAVSDAVIPKKK